MQLFIRDLHWPDPEFGQHLNQVDIDTITDDNNTDDDSTTTITTNTTNTNTQTETDLNTFTNTIGDLKVGLRLKILNQR